MVIGLGRHLVLLVILLEFLQVPLVALAAQVGRVQIDLNQDLDPLVQIVRLVMMIIVAVVTNSTQDLKVVLTTMMTIIMIRINSVDRVQDHRAVFSVPFAIERRNGGMNSFQL
jgi:hypothetical protein